MSIFQTGAPGTNERLISLATTNNPVAYESIRTMDLGYDLSKEMKESFLSNYFADFYHNNFHTKTVTATLAFEERPGNFVLITGDETGCLKIWDIFRGHFLGDFDPTKTHTKKVSSIAFYRPSENRDVANYRIITSSEDRSVIIWDYSTRELVFKVDEKEPVTCLAISEEYGIFVYATNDKHIHLYSLARNYKIRSFGTKHTDLILSIALLPGKSEDQMQIISVGWDKRMVCWDVNGTEIGNFEKGHTKSITTLVAHYTKGEESTESDDEPPILITGSLDKTAIIWDFESRRKVRTLAGHKGQITSIKVSDRDDDGSPPIVVTSSLDKSIVLWDLLTGHHIRVIKFSEPLLTLALVDSSLGISLFATGKSNRLLMWDLRRTTRTKVFASGGVTTIDVVTSTSPKDRNHEPILMIGDVETHFNIYELKSGDRLEDPVKNHTKRINGCAVYPATDNVSTRVVSVDGNCDIKVWDFETKQVRKTLTGHQIVVLTVAIYDPTLFGRSRANYVRQNKTSPPKVDVQKPCIITGAGDKSIKVWNLLEGVYQFDLVAEVPNAHESFVRSIVVQHPVDPTDRPRFISGSYDKTATLWDLETLTPLQRYVNVHTDFVFFTAIYDPAVQFALTPDLDADRSNPAVITSSYDGTIGIWDMMSGTLRRHLPEKGKGVVGHSDSVTALAVYIPPFGSKDAPIIATGSIDRLIMLWNLFTGEKIQTLIGHKDRVCYITIYTPPGKHPLLISGGDDQQTIVWKDSLYQESFMPLRETVNRAFDFDLESIEDWPMITELATKYKALLFMENSNLFTMAVIKDRPEFLLKFWDYLVLTLPTIKKVQYRPNDTTPRDIFSIAILKNDLISVRAISLAWIKNLNSEMDNMLTQRFYHSSYFFPDEALRNLAKYYPSEFIFFVKNLRLIRNEKSLMEGIQQKFLDPSQRLEFRGSNSRIQKFSSFWANFSNLENYIIDSTNQLNSGLSAHKLHFFDNLLTRLDTIMLKIYTEFANLFEITIEPQPVISLMVPVKNGQDVYKYLSLFVQVSNQLNDVQIFESDLGLIFLQYFWHIRGRRVHVLAFFKYIMFLALFLATVYGYAPHYNDHPGIIIISILCIIGFVWYGYEEYAQMFKMFNVTKFSFLVLAKHFVDLWNLVDLIIVVTGIVGLVLRLGFMRDTPTGRSFLALTSIFMWFKLLYFLRPFSSSGPLVAMIIQIAMEIRTFLFVLFCVLAGFAQAFWLLSNNEESNLFGTVSQSFLTSFLYMLGQNVVADFSGTASPYVATVILVFFMITMMILMLNLLIALMGDVFSKVREQGHALWRKEQASIILEESFLYEDDKTIPKHLFVLKYTSEVANKGLNYREQIDNLISSSDLRKFIKFEDSTRYDQVDEF